VNKYEQREIYGQMLSYRQAPDSLFAGSPERLAALRMGIMGYP
jgi:hypothetical protein